MNALRHHPGRSIVINHQIGQEWVGPDGRTLFNMSGGSLSQSLVLDASSLAGLSACVTPSSGFESPTKAAAEGAILGRVPWANACLWASSGSDAIEQSCWAVECLAQREYGRPLATFVVRRGGYHGNTFLGRFLSSRGRDEANRRTMDDRAVHIIDEGRRGAGATFISRLQQLWDDGEVRLPALVLLEPFPTTGRNFVADPDELRAIMTWCQARGIYVVFDEVACGVYRQGIFSASEHLASVYPTASVFAKGLTCGAYPLSVVVVAPSVAAAVRDLPSKPISFTYGLTEYAAAILLRALSIYDDLHDRGRLEERGACVRDICDYLQNHVFEVECTLTTIRLAGPRVQIARLVDALRGRDYWVYAGYSAIKPDTAVRTRFEEYGYIHICPPLNTEPKSVHAQLRALGEIVYEEVLQTSRASDRPRRMGQ